MTIGMGIGERSIRLGQARRVVATEERRSGHSSMSAWQQPGKSLQNKFSSALFFIFFAYTCTKNYISAIKKHDIFMRYSTVTLATFKENFVTIS